MPGAQAIRGAAEVSRKILDCADVGTCGMLSVITALEFFQHYFSEMGHRDLLVTPNLSQTIKQPTLSYLTRSVRRRAATSKRRSKQSGQFPDGWHYGNYVM